MQTTGRRNHRRCRKRGGEQDRKSKKIASREHENADQRDAHPRKRNRPGDAVEVQRPRTTERAGA